MAALTAEVARHRVAMAAAQADPGAAATMPVMGLAPQFRLREQIVLDADLAQLHSELADLTGKLGENLARHDAAETAIRTGIQIVRTLGAQLHMREQLHADGWESLVDVLTARQALQQEEVTVAAAHGELTQAETERTTELADFAGTRTKFVDDNATALKQADDQLDQAREALVRAAEDVRHTDIWAPIDGTVQELAVTTLGQVATPGQQLMTIVPRAPALEMEALVENKDVGFVRAGQPAVIKLETFAYTRYGTISGKVVRVSRDAVPSREAAANQDQEAKPTEPQPGDASSVPDTQNLVFPVTVRLDRSSIDVDGRAVALSAGLQATVDIATGRRRALSYLLSPIVDVTSSAMHER